MKYVCSLGTSIKYVSSLAFDMHGAFEGMCLRVFVCFEALKICIPTVLFSRTASQIRLKLVEGIMIRSLLH
jgi:hypothetical protein